MKDEMTSYEISAYGFKKWSWGLVMGAVIGFVVGWIYLEIDANCRYKKLPTQLTVSHITSTRIYFDEAYLYMGNDEMSSSKVDINIKNYSVGEVIFIPRK